MICTAYATVFLLQAAIDVDAAARYFTEARWAAKDDGGALWGKSLEGPMLFVEPRSRTVVTSEAPPDSGFQRRGDVYVGPLPAGMLVANTAVEWKGRKWSMIMWPLPESRTERTRLMMHEAWHRIQPEIGLEGESVTNAHLDTMEGRIWLQLEIRALRAAMLTDGTEREKATRDALLFRAARQRRFPTAKAQEDRMEVHEGLAEYTGMMLHGTPEPETRYALAYRMLHFGQRASFPSSFAYETGPAYGLLNALNGSSDWRRGLTTKSSLADLTASLVGFKAPPDVDGQAHRIARSYGDGPLRASEKKRESDRMTREALYRGRLVDGPVLRLPLAQMNFVYDPNAAFPLGELGTVHPKTTISDRWGTIVVTKGALVAADFRNVYVTAPREANSMEGDGWTLTLNPGWN